MGARPRAALALAAATALGLAGCGYGFVRYGGDGAPRSRVAVRTLANDSFEPGYELTVTEALREEFLRRGALALVDDPQGADLVLSGRVRRIGTRPLAASSVVLALEYELRVRLELRARRRDGSEVALDPRLLAGRELYLASADLEATRKNREEALRRIAGALAARVHDAVYEAAAP